MTNIKRPRAANLSRINMENIIQTIKPNIKFNDIIGCDTAKNILKDFSYALKEEDNYYRKFGCNIPKGILLHGPSGCGKTMLSKAFCYNTNALFYNIKLTDIFVKWFSETELNLKYIINDAFQRSKVEKVPAILYFDDLSSFFCKPDQISREGLSLRLCNVLNEEFNSFSENENVYILGCAKEIESLNPSIYNSSIFSYHCKVNLPNNEERKKFFEKLITDFTESSKRRNWIQLDIDILSKKTAYFSYSDIENLFNCVLIKKAKLWKNSHINEPYRDQSLLYLKNEDFII